MSEVEVIEVISCPRIYTTFASLQDCFKCDRFCGVSGGKVWCTQSLDDGTRVPHFSVAVPATIQGIKQMLYGKRLVRNEGKEVTVAGMVVWTKDDRIAVLPSMNGKNFGDTRVTVPLFEVWGGSIQSTLKLLDERMCVPHLFQRVRVFRGFDDSGHPDMVWFYYPSMLNLAFPLPTYKFARILEQKDNITVRTRRTMNEDWSYVVEPSRSGADNMNRDDRGRSSTQHLIDAFTKQISEAWTMLPRQEKGNITFRFQKDGVDEEIECGCGFPEGICRCCPECSEYPCTCEAEDDEPNCPACGESGCREWICEYCNQHEADCSCACEGCGRHPDDCQCW